MTDNKSTRLINLLKQEVSLLDTLIAILAEEKSALYARQYEVLETLANEKQTLSEQLEESARERVELLQMNNKQPKPALQTFLQLCTADEANQINQLSNQLSERLASCRELNAVNGQVIASNLNSRQEIISTLTGQDPRNAVNVYTASGNVKSNMDNVRHEKA